MTTQKTENEIGFPVYPEMWMNYADMVWRRRKRRAEAMYALVILLARECKGRAEVYGGRDDWFFDVLDVRRTLVGAGIDY